ncbi:hypothetical protein BC939DRAFT_62364 [Gamsiella multidivaricata]|uniref:uncharacterized protein n=1 Tax=Gamsiella multidivaricata TaxID=101098 RepID=UPI00221F3A4A|nr:uncharacterized protein BC939DRAFT_62364 [Gamsiella multidivaricata]KAI7828650.1 hypothetical protein BC939DRAFT_62364 [Gamsiella multidivaricata]
MDGAASEGGGGMRSHEAVMNNLAMQDIVVAGHRHQGDTFGPLDKDNRAGQAASSGVGVFLEILKVKSLKIPPPNHRERAESSKTTLQIVEPGAAKIEDTLGLSSRNTNSSNSSSNSSNGSNSNWSRVKLPVSAGPAPPGDSVAATNPWTSLYNQTHVDGSWGCRYICPGPHPKSTPPPPARSTVHPFTPASTSTSTPTRHQGTAPWSPSWMSHRTTLASSRATTVRSRASSVSHAHPPRVGKLFFRNWLTRGSLAQPVISMHLEHDGGIVLLGEIDREQYTGELIYNPVTDLVSWQISLLFKA